MIPSRADFILERWRQLIEVHLPAECSGGSLVASTFMLYRREHQGSAAVPPTRDDLGLQSRPVKQDFELVASGIPCLVEGTNVKRDRWAVYPEGQDQIEEANLYAAYLDIREGDNLVVAQDGKTYAVEASTRLGPLVRCFITTAKAQL